jgi:hypothetical protein
MKFGKQAVWITGMATGEAAAIRAVFEQRGVADVRS